MDITKEKTLGKSIILLVYFALKPLYFGSSGYLQIGDAILLLFFICLVIRDQGIIRFDHQSSSLLAFFLAIIAYQILINGIWSIITGDVGMNWHDLYYIFNFLAFSGCIYIGQSVGVERVKRAVGIGSFIAVILTAVGLIISSGLGSRSTGFFNNPNQLGYFSVIMLTVIALCKEQLSRFQIGTILVLSFWAIIASLSKAAILAYFAEVIVLILFYQNNRSVKRLILEFILLGALIGVIYFIFYSNNRLVLSNRAIYQVRYRIINMADENDSGLAYGRGYARVGEILPHIVWGTGEGAYDRFSVRNGTEVHSTFASLLTCYGLIGILGYLVVFKQCMGRRKTFIQNAVLLTGLFLYAITHNGIRNTLLWIIMAVLFLERIRNKNDYNLQIATI